MGPTDSDTMNLLLSIIGQRRRVFNPLSLAPALWLDASDDATLFDATSGGSLPTNGNDIARWEDKSGNGRHFTQSSAAACPHRQTGVQNGLPVARFDGSNDVLTMASGLDILRNKSGASMVAAYRWISNPTSASAVALVSTGSNATSARMGLLAGATSRKPYTAARALDADLLAFVTASANNPTAAMTQAGIVNYSASTARQYVNNTLDGSSNSFLSGVNTQDTNSIGASIGAASSSLFANIDFFELFVFNRAISDSDRNALNAYLVAKWGI